MFINETGKLVYFVSKKLAGAKLRYCMLHKVTLAFVYTASKLKPYFQGRTVKV